MTLGGFSSVQEMAMTADHRGAEPEFVAPTCGYHLRPCKGIVRDRRAK